VLSHVADSLTNTVERYDSLTADVDSILSALSAVEPRWRHFEQSVADIGDWLSTQLDNVSQLDQLPDHTQASAQCQVSIRDYSRFV